MPWCDDCAKFWTPTSMGEGGTCPSCGRTIGAGDRIDPKKMNVRALAAGDDVKAPWHFKVLIALVVLYLTWRVVQLVGLLF